MIEESVKQSITNDLVNGINPKELEKKYGVSRTTVYRLRKTIAKANNRKVDHDLDLKTIKHQLKEQKTRYQASLGQIADLQKELNQYQHLTELSKILLPANWKILPSVKKEVIAFLNGSDWHIDEEVDPDEIGGVNEYNTEIAERRIEMFFRYALKLLNGCRSMSVINKLVIGALGDFISGWIHDELMEASSMTPPEAIVFAFELWLNGLQFLLDEGDLEEITVVCCCGNHSRITKKNEVKKSHKKTYEWLLYQFLAKWFAMKGETRIKFKLPEGYFNWLTVFGRDIRFHHGNRISYRGGVGGIHIPLRKAVAQWNKARHADLDVLAHWHTRETSKDYVINGSAIGYNEFAESIKADFGPPEQSFFIIHPEFGKTAEFPIVLP